MRNIILIPGFLAVVLGCLGVGIWYTHYLKGKTYIGFGLVSLYTFLLGALFVILVLIHK